MGQRSQIYVRYNNGKNLFAYHLQFNWGRYMINRASQILDFLEKETKGDYSAFKSSKFDLVNSEFNERNDIKILKALTELNLSQGSIVRGIDLIDENFSYFNHTVKDNFVFEPERQDNNNGILVIDIVEENERVILKYGLTKGYEGLKEGEEGEYKIVSAKEYYEAYESEFDDYLENAENEEERLEILAHKEEIKIQAEVIDEKYQLLTQEEYENIFSQEYSYQKCLSKADYKNGIKCINERLDQIRQDETRYCYNNLIAFSGNLKEEQIDKEIEKCKQFFKDNDIEVISFENSGLKNLPYEVKGNKKGTILLFKICSKKADYFKFEDIVEKNENVIKFIKESEGVYVEENEQEKAEEEV